MSLEHLAVSGRNAVLGKKKKNKQLNAFTTWTEIFFNICLQKLAMNLQR